MPVVFGKDIKLDPEELEKLIQEKKARLQEIKNNFGKNTIYIQELSELALLLIEAKKYKEAEEIYEICLIHFQNQKDRLGKAAVFGLQATLFFKKQNYQTAIEFYTLAYDIYLELNQYHEAIMCLKGIGSSYIKMGSLDNACEAFLECSALCSDNEDIYGLLDCLGNLVQIHETLERWDVVKELYLKSLEAFEKLKDSKGISITNFNLGILKRKEQSYKDALLYFKQGTNQAIESNYVELIIKGLGYIGETLFYLGRIKEAKDEYIKALHLAEKVSAQNAIYQLRILLKSLGLRDNNIKQELQEYSKKRR
ncbi:MAG: tetratricopeptide repeat protein [Promethearchaeota archaeon]